MKPRIAVFGGDRAITGWPSNVDVTVYTATDPNRKRLSQALDSYDATIILTRWCSHSQYTALKADARGKCRLIAWPRGVSGLVYAMKTNALDGIDIREETPAEAPTAKKLSAKSLEYFAKLAEEVGPLPSVLATATPPAPPQTVTSSTPAPEPVAAPSTPQPALTAASVPIPVVAAEMYATLCDDPGSPWTMDELAVMTSHTVDTQDHGLLGEALRMFDHVTVEKTVTGSKAFTFCPPTPVNPPAPAPKPVKPVKPVINAKESFVEKKKSDADQQQYVIIGAANDILFTGNRDDALHNMKLWPAATLWKKLKIKVSIEVEE